MNKSSHVSNISEYIQSLITSNRLGPQVAYHEELKEKASSWATPSDPWPKDMSALIKSAGIKKLYNHQISAINSIRSGEHVVVATPTASGKTLIYNLPVIEKIITQPKTRAFYIFPLKALAQDQLQTFRKLASFCPEDEPTAEIYDGDTSNYQRKKIREIPPNIVITNPDMLHLSFLPYHGNWADFFSDLRYVVIDEVHTYRGVMGSHMSQVFRRFQRICTYYGSFPTFIFCSATVANPAQLVEQLTGLSAKTVLKSGAPLGKKHIVFMDPVQGPAQTAILLLKAALYRGLRTIVYTQSRKLTELISIWAGSRSGPFAERISAYRAGFLPEERREIEAKLSSGELLAVISTSALELGIDIGDLDLCILVGYPGSVVATMQRFGRVGRSGQESALVMIAGEDALDQYFVRNPQEFRKRKPEAAVINSENPDILEKHIVCAAAELPMARDDSMLSSAIAKERVLKLEETGKLLKSADGNRYFSSRKVPQRRVDLRGTGQRFSIISRGTQQHRGDIDLFRAFKETHPGAVYLHKGETLIVEKLDLNTHTVIVKSGEFDFYTRVKSHKDTEILKIYEEKRVWGTRVYFGRVKVTDQVTGYEKWKIQTKKRMETISLNLPPLVFETESLWFEIPDTVQERTESMYLHFMGGIHAIEHAAIGIFPLLIMADRNDLGGISIPLHPQMTCAAVFIYDGVPGGGGLSRQAFKHANELLALTLKVIRTCPCENGCPSCVHSPKCGSGNRPIDKSSALFILDHLKKRRRSHSEKKIVVAKEDSYLKKPDDQKRKRPQVVDSPEKDDSTLSSKRFMRSRGMLRKRLRNSQRSRATIQKEDKRMNRDSELPTGTGPFATQVHYGVFDIETQRSAQEVGGWHRADLMRVSCVVLYDSIGNIYHEYTEDKIDALISHIQKLELVIGFNIKRFDFQVLSGYSDFRFNTLPTLDILEEVHNRLGYRLSLDNIASETLGVKKSADGLQALKWWKKGQIRKIVEYCKKDVEITRDLFLYGSEKGYLLFKNKAGNAVRIPVDWKKGWNL